MHLRSSFLLTMLYKSSYLQLQRQPEFLRLPHEEDELSPLLAIMIPVWHIVDSISALRGILRSSHVFHKFIVCSIYQHRRAGLSDEP